jgi:hypothetical protein
MAPRASKLKTPAKAIVATPATTAPLTALSSSGEFTGEFFDLYNDLLVAKNELLAAEIGLERRKAIGELGACLVCLSFIWPFRALLISFFRRGCRLC